MAITKGIILAGGKGTRLHPATSVVCKQLLPIYDKPMIYYPLSTLMLSGIQDVLIISTPSDLPRFLALLGDGKAIGMRFSYAVQEQPSGIAQAFILGERFIGDDSVALILGDNVFYGTYDFLRTAREFTDGALVFAYYVKDPERYGVVGFATSGEVESIEEKPAKAKSNYAVTGFYLYDNEVVQFAHGITPSRRGELEITDLNARYLEGKRLKVVQLGRGMAWLDTGTHDSLLDASEFIATIERRQGHKIGCVEEIARRMKFIDGRQMQAIIDQLGESSYRDYLIHAAREIDAESQ